MNVDEKQHLISILDKRIEAYTKCFQCTTTVALRSAYQNIKDIVTNNETA